MEVLYITARWATRTLVGSPANYTPWVSIGKRTLIFDRSIQGGPNRQSEGNLEKRPTVLRAAAKWPNPSPSQLELQAAFEVSSPSLHIGLQLLSRDRTTADTVGFLFIIYPTGHSISAADSDPIIRTWNVKSPNCRPSKNSEAGRTALLPPHSP